MIPHLKERRMFLDDAERLGSIEEAANLWQIRAMISDEWLCLHTEPEWISTREYRRRPKMLHVIDAKGVRHEFPPPMREAPRRGQNYWAIMVDDGRIICSSWWDDPADEKRLKLGRCQSTEEGAQQQLAALRAVCLGGDV